MKYYNQTTTYPSVSLLGAGTYLAVCVLAIIIGIIFLLELLWNANIFKTLTGILKITQWVKGVWKSMFCLLQTFSLGPDRSDDPGTQF